MRSTAVAVLAMILASPLGAQGRDSVVIRRDADAARTQERQVRTAEREIESRLRSTRSGIDAANQHIDEIRLHGNLVRLQTDAVMRQRSLAPMHGVMAATVVRPRLGIAVALEARATDNVGAYVNGVTPGGPADKAGIRAGDLIKKIGKNSLTERDNVRRREGESAPGLKLIEVVGKLEAGKAVSVEYRRGTRDQETKVTPEESDFSADAIAGSGATFWRRGEDAELIARLAVPPAQFADSMRRTLRLTPRAAPGAPMDGGEFRFSTAPNGTYSYAFTTGGPLGKLELTSLNAGLGSYFGASEGVLVINAPTTDNYGLMAGDVITAIDGRKVSSPSQLMRIMRTYEKSESPKLQIMRQKRVESVSITLP